jgi:hypothetical protein
VRRREGLRSPHLPCLTLSVIDLCM